MKGPEMPYATVTDIFVTDEIRQPSTITHREKRNLNFRIPQLSFLV